MSKQLTPEQNRACQRLECQKAYVFTQGVKAGLPTDFAREMAETFAIGWQQGYNYAKQETIQSPGRWAKRQERQDV